MKSKGRPPHNDQLTPAEWRVAEGVRHGLTNPAIAKRLGISPDAVKFHVSSVLAKLGLPGRKALRQWDGVRADSVMGGTPVDPPADAPSLVLGQVALKVSNLERAIDWYANILGLPLVMEFEGMAFLQAGETRLYVSIGDPGQNALLYFCTPNLHAMVNRLMSAGAPLVAAPHRIHVHSDGREEWMAFVKDPDGTVFGLMAIAQPPAKDEPSR
jgi:catechol 2,3-dioxygenase-like lactoylglutathione lyase family enzyme/DNA-binding CsgD family transcriptional regulator